MNMKIKKKLSNFNNLKDKFLVGALIIAIVLIIYLLGKTQSAFLIESRQQPLPTIEIPIYEPSPTNAPTPTNIQQQKFDYNGCIAKAGAIGENCLSQCKNEALNKGDQCNGFTDPYQHQNCLNQASSFHDSCLQDCLSTAKIDLNNCRLGISP